MEKQELIDWLKFCKVRKIGSSKVLKLFGIFGTFDKLFNAKDEELYRTRVFDEEMIKQFSEVKSEDGLIENFTLDICEREKIKVIPIYSEDYPSNLKNLPDAPLTLYMQGNTNLLKVRKIAIVGSRKSDENALRWALNASKGLVKEGIVIVSGGAKGIDYQAHQGALKLGGKTICVFGSGLLKLYPPENREMFAEIKNNGGLFISEHSPADKGSRLSLLRRNRIISGISDSIIIVTSAKEGGSRTQIEIANKQRIPIFVPKISLNFTPNEGISDAIKQHRIKDIENYEEVFMETYSNKKKFSIQKTL
ncbi:MAG: DNA-processing protein DprA [Candidatus Pacearchaeota archaeon]|jgi:DNA processing protein